MFSRGKCLRGRQALIGPLSSLGNPPAGTAAGTRSPITLALRGRRYLAVDRPHPDAHLQAGTATAAGDSGSPLTAHRVVGIVVRTGGGARSSHINWHTATVAGLRSVRYVCYVSCRGLIRRCQLRRYGDHGHALAAAARPLEGRSS